MEMGNFSCDEPAQWTPHKSLAKSQLWWKIEKLSFNFPQNDVVGKLPVDEARFACKVHVYG